MVQLSHPYETTGKTIVLTICAFFSKVMSLLFSVPSNLSQLFFQETSVFYSWLQFLYSDFGAKKIKSGTVSTVSPFISHEVMGPDAMIFVF